MHHPQAVALQIHTFARKQLNEFLFSAVRQQLQIQKKNIKGQRRRTASIPANVYILPFSFNTQSAVRVFFFLLCTVSPQKEVKPEITFCTLARLA